MGIGIKPKNVSFASVYGFSEFKLNYFKYASKKKSCNYWYWGDYATCC